MSADANGLKLDVGILVPDFKESLTFDSFQALDPQTLSAAVVLFLLVVAGIFLLYSIIEAVRSYLGVRYYSKLIGDVDETKLAESQRDILKKAESNKRYGKLWKEFDESLVVSPAGDKLSNTLDASHFFNTNTLARGLTENRLLAAVPGFLTAIGVIGTFAGLQMGLANLNLSDDQSVEQIKTGIGYVTTGAAIAFMTSVWGVGTSVIFNFLEKFLERWVRSNIAKLQNQIDHLYPRIIAEQSLVKIADYSKNSNETLQGLAEKIGDRLQEALVDATDNIGRELQKSLNEIMAPAIASLVNNANEGSEKALDGLLTKFLAGVGEAGDEQQKMMRAASEQIDAATSNLATQMSEISGRLESAALESHRFAEEQSEKAETMMSRISAEADTRQQQLTTNFQNLMGQMKSNVEEMNKTASEREAERNDASKAQFESMLNAGENAVQIVTRGVSQQLDEMGHRDKQRSEELTKNINAIGVSQNELINSVTEMIASQRAVHTDIIAQLRELQSSYALSTESQNRSSEAVLAAAGEMQESSGNLRQLGMALQTASQQLTSGVSMAAEITKELAETNSIISSDIQRLGESYNASSDQIAAITNQLKSATDEATTGFNLFKDALTQQVRELEEQVSSVLQQYAEQVRSQTQERMNEWNAQTSEYTNSMIEAMQALAGAVAEIEDNTNKLAQSSNRLVAAIDQL